jgi:hypothetical protein
LYGDGEYKHEEFAQESERKKDTEERSYCVLREME